MSDTTLREWIAMILIDDDTPPGYYDQHIRYIEARIRSEVREAVEGVLDQVMATLPYKGGRTVGYDEGWDDALDKVEQATTKLKETNHE